MNIARNMEPIIIAAVIALGVISVATGSKAETAPATASATSAKSTVNMPVVVITGKRMTAEEKKASE